MTDNLRNYHIIRQGLEQLYPTRLEASQLRLLRTLALVIHGLIASAHSQLPKLAAQARVAGAVIWKVGPSNFRALWRMSI
jgi:UDP-N-acetylglucosamine enolpyruvyl transferase